jgi:hypothetical protein
MLSVGPLGIDAIGLRGPFNELLTGNGIKIGQVEDLRPADPDVDDLFANPTLNPAQVWRQQQTPSPDDDFVGHHATFVASVMISSDDDARGVAPGASLYADAYVVRGTNISEALRAMQHVVIGSGGDVRAINNSWLKPGQGGDGASQVTLGVDWIATRYDTLVVFAGAQTDSPDENIPADNFNGITVASSDRVGGAGAYRKVAAGNRFEIYPTDHYETDLLAPGENVDMTGLGGLASTDDNNDGSSFAAPHVVGTVALLQQYAESEMLRPGTLWTSDARRHEVMKAVLLNSADKISGVQGSTRTVLNQFDQNWTQTTAYNDPEVPLDAHMGAGHLNARRALTQFSAGPIDGFEIDRIGWHFGETGGFGTVHSFPLAETFSGGWVSITLAWDRIVGKLGPIESTYTSSDLFLDGGFNSLDIYLLPIGWQTLNDSVASSLSIDETVEHIFAQVPAGNYEIVVHQSLGGGDQKYGLAWWMGDAPADIDGDFDGDGDVDGDDLGEWKGGFGPGAGGDADGDGDSDGNDFLVWQQNLGRTSATPVARAVPEPSAWLLCSLGSLVCFRGRRFNATRN